MTSPVLVGHAMSEAVHLSAREKALQTLAQLQLATFPDYFPEKQIWFTVVLGWLALMASFLIVRQGVLQRKPPIVRAARTLEHLVGLALTVFFIANVYYKLAMGWVYAAYLLYPCHSLSIAWIYVIWSKNHRRAEFVWNLLIFYTQFPLLALLFPDTSDVVFPFQTEVYWCQHILLVCTPLILFFTKRYHIERVSHHWFFVAVLFGMWYCFGLQLAVGVLTRVNINYTLWPPPGHEHESPLSGQYYHVKMTGILFALAWLVGYPLIWLAALAERFLRASPNIKKLA